MLVISGMTSKCGESWWILCVRRKVVRVFFIVTFELTNTFLTVEDRAVHIKQEYTVFKSSPVEVKDKMYSDLAAHAASEDLLPPLTRMKNAVDAEQTSTTRISRFNDGIMVLSMVIYTGDDQAAWQASAVVVGDSFGRDIMQEHIVDVKKALNGVVDIVQCVVE